MDRRVKERLIGASILGVLVVLVVPELLSGPAPATSAAAPSGQPEPTRSVTVDLTTSKATSAEGSASPGDAAGSARPGGGGAQAGSPPPEPRTAPSVVTLPASPRAPPAAAENPAPAVERPASPPKSSSQAAKPPGHAWAVQLGVFASRSNADRLAHGLKTQGFPVYVVSGGSAGTARYRVRIGPLADRSAAAQALTRLQSMGHPGSLVPPGA
ncbi:MAG TPA: SPOR domain-containing protein [Steroidobacteraceae bacterium]|jgi:DedD protein|nr:SPOR domain-containing protein [Steroidobacteraceae bacterium]